MGVCGRGGREAGEGLSGCPAAALRLRSAYPLRALVHRACTNCGLVRRGVQMANVELLERPLRPSDVRETDK